MPDFKLEDIPDKHGNIPKLGDHIRFTLYEGCENVVAQIQLDENGYHTPQMLKYLEYEIYDGVKTKNDIALDDLIRTQTQWGI